MRTLDSLIEHLQQLKAQGTPGNIPIVSPALDNNSGRGFAKRIDAVVQVSLAKSDVDKGWEVCKLVSNRGVPALLIG